MNFLPPRIPKKAKRDTRWRSQGHRNFVASHACTNCGYMPDPGGRNIAAHVRLGSHSGMGQKPDDHRCVSLCGPHGVHEGCHDMQHRLGEATFWKGRDVEMIIEAFCKASPKRREIEAEKRERGQ